MSTTRKRNLTKENKNAIRKQQIANAERNNPETNANRSFKERARQIRNRQFKNATKSKIKKYIKDKMDLLSRIRIEMINFNERGGDPTIKERLNFLYDMYFKQVVDAEKELNSL